MFDQKLTKLWIVTSLKNVKQCLKSTKIWRLLQVWQKKLISLQVKRFRERLKTVSQHPNRSVKLIWETQRNQVQGDRIRKHLFVGQWISNWSPFTKKEWRSKALRWRQCETQTTLGASEMKNWKEKLWKWQKNGKNQENASKIHQTMMLWVKEAVTASIQWFLSFQMARHFKSNHSLLGSKWVTNR